MTISVKNKQSVLLDYQLSTSPSPLEVSASSKSNGTLIFKVDASKRVLCKEITIMVPVGAEAVELFLTSPEPIGETNSNEWTIASQVKTGKDLGLLEINYCQFILINGNSDSNVHDGFTITISGDVNAIQGDASVLLIEKSKAFGSKAFSTKTKTFSVFKTTSPEFYVRSFVASLKASPDLPISEFTNGATFQLSWESNGNSYEIYEKGQTKPIITTTETTCEITSGITTVTTFILKAIYKDQNVLDALTLTVSNPSLTLQTLKVVENLQVNGEAEFNRNIQAYTLQVDGIAAFSGETVGNKAVFDMLNCKSELKAEGSATLGTTAITKGTFTKSFDAKMANVSMFNSMLRIASGNIVVPSSYKASSDGFVIVTLQSSSSLSKLNIAVATVVINDATFQILHSTTNQWLNSSNSMCIPVSNGDTFAISFIPGIYPELGATFYWKPIGASGIKTALVEIENEKLIDEVKIKSDIKSLIKDRKSKQVEAAGSFIDSLEKIFDVSVKKKKKAKLVRKLLDINRTL